MRFLRSVQPHAALLLFVLSTVASPRAEAVVDGTPPQAYQNFRLFGGATALGNTLMERVPSRPEVNSQLLASSEAEANDVPLGSTIQGAYVFWSGSTADSGVDRRARLTMPNGRSSNVNADRCITTEGQFGGGDTVDFFYCRADVTALVSANPASSGNYRGRYGLGNVTARPGTLNDDGTCEEANTCQAMYAGWSLLMVYEDPAESTLRDVVIFDGFRLLDETPFSDGVDRFTITGFDVADPPEASFTFFGLEGDALLGIPPQDSDPVFGCDECFDYISFNGRKLSDANNPENNIWNSTTPAGGALGIDIDTFDISDLVSPGTRTARIEIGSGDGDTSTGQAGGGGELVFMGYVMLTINRRAPDFRSSRTFKSVDPTEAGPGETLFYTVQVTNDGSQDATNVFLRDAMPANTSYVSGSTRVDGSAVADVSGRSPLEAGLGLGTVPFSGDGSSVRVTFRVQVNDDAPAGGVIQNTATIISDQVEDVNTNTVTTRISAPTLGTPTKAWTDLNGGDVEPGDRIRYDIEILNNSGRTASGITFVDDLPSAVQLESVLAPGFTDISNFSGGANGTGRVEIRDIVIPVVSERAFISFTVQVDSVDELVADGIPPASIDGFLVRNQGLVSAAFLAADLRTDNPATGSSPDATDFRLSSPVNFFGNQTFKVGTDVNGGSAEPGDAVVYTVSVGNTGSTAATISLVDDIPAGLTNVSTVTTGGGLALIPPPAGAFGAGQVRLSATVGGGETVAFQIQANIADDVVNGQRIENSAALEVASFPDQNQVLRADPFIVVAGPDFSQTAKRVTGSGGGFQPGDRVFYEVEFENTGNQPGVGVVVTDRVDPLLTNVQSGSGTFDPSGGTITWNVGDVPVGGSVTLAFEATISAAATNGAVVSNQALVVAGGLRWVSDDPTTGALDDSTDFEVRALGDLVVTKLPTAVEGAFEPGRRIRYTITVSNQGRAAATNVRVTDPLDSASLTGIAVSSGTLTGGSTALWDGSTVPALASLGTGESVDLIVEATLAGSLGDDDRVLNQALASADNILADELSDDPRTAAANDPTEIVINADPDLAETIKTVVDENGGEPQPGDALTYTIEVVNSGAGVANGVVVTDAVDSDLTNVTPLDGGVFDAGSGTITWRLPSGITPGTSATVSFTSDISGAATAGTLISNQAVIDWDGRPAGDPLVSSDDPATPAVDDSTDLTVRSQPDFVTSSKSVTDDSGDGIFEPGERVVYTLQIANTGTQAASNVVVRDAIPAGLTAVVPDAGAVEGGDVVWRIPTIAAGGVQAVGFRADIQSPIDNGFEVSNQAFVTSTEVTEPVPTDDPDTEALDDATVFSVLAEAALSAQKSVTQLDGEPPRPGSRVSYSVALVNTGTATARNVVVTDVIDANLSNVVPTSGTFDEGTRTITWTVAELSPSVDAPEILGFTAEVAAPLDNGTVIRNQASVTYDDQVGGAQLTDDPATSEEGDSTDFQVVAGFDFSNAAKAVNDDGGLGYRPGDTVTYLIGFTNAGDAAARNVEVRDVLPAELELVSAEGAVVEAGALVWRAGTLPDLLEMVPGDEVSVEVTARIVVPLADGTVVGNQAEITAEGLVEPFVTDDPATDEPDDATRFTVTSEPDLTDTTKAVTDLDGDDLIEPLDELEYSIEVVNRGTDAAEDVVVSDELPAELENVVPLDGGRLEGNRVVWDASGTPSLAAVSPDIVPQLRFRATIRELTPDGTVVSNQAVVSASNHPDELTDDPATGLGDNDPTDAFVVSQPRLDASTKSVADLNGGDFELDDEVTYTIVVENAGSQTAVGVEVEDVVPVELEILSAPAGTISGQTVSWSLGSVPPRSAETLTVRARIRPDTPDGARVANQATISSANAPLEVTDDPSTPEPDDATAFEVGGAPDLTLSTKTVVDLNGGFVERGDLVQWVIELSNAGPGTARGVEVSDVVDLSVLGDVFPGQGGVFSGNTVTWTSAGNPSLLALPAGETVELTFTTRILDNVVNGTRVSNQARVQDAEGLVWVTDDPLTAEPGDATVLRVLFPELFNATKAVEDLNGGTVNPGDTLEYTITVDAGAGTDLTAVTIVDLLDPLLGEPELPEGGIFDAGTRSLTFAPTDTPSLGLVSTGNQASVRYTVTVADDALDGAEIINQAVLTSTEVPDPVPSDDPSTGLGDDDPTIVEVDADDAPSFASSTKTVTSAGEIVLPGDTVHYEITVTNTGRRGAEDATIHDLLPELVQYVAGSTTIDGAPIGDDGGVPVVDGLGLGELEPGAVRIVGFDATVVADAPVGAVVSNTAMVSDAGRYAAPTDDPSTGAEDDATRFVVGEGPILDNLEKRATFTDLDGNGQLDVGETVRFTISMRNDGNEPASDVIFEDPMPVGSTYVAGSLALDGIPLSDEADADSGTVRGGLVAVLVGELLPGVERVLSFEVIVDAGPELVNQGRLTSRERPMELTDNNGSELDGDQPTVVPVGERALGLEVSKIALNPSGAPVGAGGSLQYLITVRNTGSSAGRLVLSDELDDSVSGFDLISGPSGATVTPTEAGAEITLDREMDAGEEVAFLFEATLAAGLTDGTTLCNRATAQLDGEDGAQVGANTDAACFSVGGLVTVASLDGVTYLDVGGADEAYDEEDDLALDDLLVEISLAGGRTVTSVVSDDLGVFDFPILEPGDYVVRLLSHRGVGDGSISLGEHELTVSAGDAREEDLFVDPSGVVYHSETGVPVDRVRANLHYGPDDPSCLGDLTDLERDCLVIDDDLVDPAQQGQLTQDGLYRFDVRPGHTYRIDLDPEGLQLSFPSTAIGPNEDVLVATQPIDVVPNALPDIAEGADRTYHLLVEVASEDGEVKNNHIPVDPSRRQILLDKRASRRSAVVGDVVTYTVTVTNQSNSDIAFDPETGLGGARVVDLIPHSFRFVRGSARGRLLTADGDLSGLPVAVTGDLVLEMSEDGEDGPTPFTIPADGQLEVRYQLVIGSDTEPGHEYENTAELRSGDGSILLSNRDRASVRVVYDPIFDQGLVIGKAYCDGNANGAQDAGEEGLIGARIYLDTGYYSTTDDYGRYHFDAIDPGTHLLKIDVDSLPFGSALTTDERRVIWVTRGTPSLVDFGVDCTEHRVRDVRVEASQTMQDDIVRLRHERYIEVAGSATEPSVTLDGNRVELPYCSLDVAFGEADHAVLGRDQLRQEMTFEVEASDGARWVVSVHNRGGDTLWMERGSGRHETVTWDGTAEGEFVLEAGELYRAILRAQRGDARCATRQFVFGAARPTPEFIYEQAFESDGFRGARPRRRLRVGIEAMAPELAAYPDEPLTVEVHHDDSLPADEALALTQERAEAARDVLAEAMGVDVSRIDAVGHGINRPMVPNVGERNRLMNRRVVIGVGDPRPTSEPPPIPTQDPPVVSARVVTTSFDLDSEGGFSGLARRGSDGMAEVEFVLQDGQTVRITLPAPIPGAAAPDLTAPSDSDGSTDVEDPVEDGRQQGPDDDPAAEPEEGDEEGEDEPPSAPDEGDGEGEDDEFIEPLTMHFDGAGGMVTAGPATPFWHPSETVRQPRFTVELAQNSGEFEELGDDESDAPRREAPQEREEPEADDDRDEPVQDEAEETDDGDPAEEVEEADGAESNDPTDGAEVPVEPVGPRRVIRSVEDLEPAELDLVLTGEMSLDEVMAMTPAGQLEINLPPAGAVLSRHELTVWGTTHEGNQLWVNGAEVAVDGRGRFRYLVELPSGPSTLVVESQDDSGNRGRLEWPVEVSNVRYFLMALGDGVVGTRGTRLDGLTDDNSTTTDSDVFHLLHGTARVYFKAWVSGQEILDGVFEEWEVTAYADTSRQAEMEELFDEVVDPERFYAVYGDTSEQVADVNARGKLYLLVTADESSATWGNFQTDIEGVQLLRYQRTLHGAQLVVNETFAEDYGTELRVHWADDENALRQSFDYLRGTGGSLYYLRHDEVTEGSERVSIVVRDRTSGAELFRRALARNEDYTMRYREGRLMMMSPVPSVVDANFIHSDTTTSRNPMVGHAVYVEVGYEHEGESDFGDSSVAVHARETYDDWLSVGGGYVREGRSEGGGEPYELWGVEASAEHGSMSRLDLEYVRSENVDTRPEYSDDGGLTFEEFHLEGEDDRRSGSGLHIAGGAEVADFLDARDEPLLYLGGYYDDIESGFFSGANVMDQGVTRFGGEARWVISPRNTVRVEHDGSNTVFDNLEAMEDATREINRQSSALQYLYDAGSLRFTLEYAHTFYDDAEEEDGFHTDIAALGMAFDVIDDLTLSLDQEVIARSDDPNVVRQTTTGRELDPGDRFTTGVSAAYRLLDTVELRASERIRYSGETATAVGIRTPMSDNIDLYVQDRFETYRDRNGSTNSIVIGGENRFGHDGNGRSYAEYQIQDGVRGDTNRALLGVGQRFFLVDGLTADLAYEHTTITDARFGGDSTRDAGSVGAEYLGLDWLKISTRLEVRFDDGNAQGPRAEPCTTASTGDSPRNCRDSLPGGTDRLQFTTSNGIDLTPIPDVTLVLRGFYSQTDDETTQVTIARATEMSFGVAYRPVEFNLVHALGRYTYLDELRPLGLDSDDSEREESHVFTIAPILNLDEWGFQLVEKLAYRRSELHVAGLPVATNNIVLWINRINYHLTGRLDASGEYRILTQSLADDRRSGFLLEASYLIEEHVRVGLGYNFTDFTDNELGDFSRDESGVFFRVTGQY